MNNVEKLVETLISATENKQISWRMLRKSETAISNNRLLLNDSAYTIDTEDEQMIVISKYMQNEKPYAPLTPDTVYIEKVSLLILDRFNGGIVTQVDEAELESSHRLWTLYKLADRSEKGADKIIDNLIDKYRGFPF